MSFATPPRSSERERRASARGNDAEFTPGGSSRTGSVLAEEDLQALSDHIAHVKLEAEERAFSLNSEIKALRKRLRVKEQENVQMRNLLPLLSNDLGPVKLDFEQEEEEMLKTEPEDEVDRDVPNFEEPVTIAWERGNQDFNRGNVEDGIRHYTVAAQILAANLSAAEARASELETELEETNAERILFADREKKAREETESLRSEIFQLTSTIENLETERDTAREESLALEKLHAEAIAKAEEMSERLLLQESLEQKIVELELRISQNAQSAYGFEEREKELSEKLNAVEQQLRISTENLSELKTSSDETISKLNSELKEAIGHGDELQGRINQLEAELSEQSSSAQNFSATSAATLEKVAALERELAAARDTIGSLELERNDLNTLVKELQNDKSLMHDRNESLSQTLVLSQAENNQLKDARDTLQQKYDAMEGELSRLKEQVDHFQFEQTQTQQKNQESEDGRRKKMLSLEAENDKMKENISKLLSKVKKLKAKAEDSDREIMRLVAENYSLSQKLEQLEMDSQRMNEEKQASEARLQNFRADAVYTEEEMEANREIFEKSLADLRKNLSEARSISLEAENNATKLTSQLDETQSTLLGNEAEIERLNGLVSSQRLEIENLQYQINIAQHQQTTYAQQQHEEYPSTLASSHRTYEVSNQGDASQYFGGEDAVETLDWLQHGNAEPDQNQQELQLPESPATPVLPSSFFGASSPTPGTDQADAVSNQISDPHSANPHTNQADFEVQIQQSSARIQMLEAENQSVWKEVQDKEQLLQQSQQNLNELQVKCNEISEELETSRDLKIEYTALQNEHEELLENMNAEVRRYRELEERFQVISRELEIAIEIRGTASELEKRYEELQAQLRQEQQRATELEQAHVAAVDGRIDQLLKDNSLMHQELEVLRASHEQLESKVHELSSLPTHQSQEQAQNFEHTQGTPTFSFGEKQQEVPSGLPTESNLSVLWNQTNQTAADLFDSPGFMSTWKDEDDVVDDNIMPASSAVEQLHNWAESAAEQQQNWTESSFNYSENNNLMQEEIDRLKRLLDERAEEHASLREENDRLALEAEAAVREKDELEGELGGQVSHLKNQLVETEQSIRLLEQDLTTVSMKNSSFESKSEADTIRIEELERDLSDSMKDFESQQSAIQKYIEEIEELRKTIEEQQTHIGTLQMQGENSAASEEALFAIRAEANEQMALLQSEIERLKEELESMRHALHDSKSQVVVLETKRESLESGHLAELEAQQQEIETLKARTVELGSNNESIQQELLSLKSSGENREALLRGLYSDISSKEEEIEGMKNDLKSAIERNDELALEKEKVDEFVAELERKIMDLEDECNRLINVKEEKESIETDLDKANEEIAEQAALLEKLRVDHENLVKHSSDLESEKLALDESKARLELLVEKIPTLEKEIEELNRYLQNAEVARDNAQNEVEELSNRQSTQIYELELAKGEVEKNMKEMLESHTEKCLAWEDSMRELKEKMKSQEDDFVSRTLQSNQMSEQLRSKIVELEEDLETAKNETKLAEQSFKTQLLEFAEKSGEQENRIHSLETSLSLEKAQVRELENEKMRLQQEMDDMNESINGLREQLSDTRVVEELKKELLARDEALARVVKRVSVLNQRNEELQLQLKDVRQEAAAMYHVDVSAEIEKSSNGLRRRSMTPSPIRSQGISPLLREGRQKVTTVVEGESSSSSLSSVEEQAPLEGSEQPEFEYAVFDDFHATFENVEGILSKVIGIDERRVLSSVLEAVDVCKALAEKALELRNEATSRADEYEQCYVELQQNHDLLKAEMEDLTSQLVERQSELSSSESQRAELEVVMKQHETRSAECMEQIEHLEIELERLKCENISLAETTCQDTLESLGSELEGLREEAKDGQSTKPGENDLASVLNEVETLRLKCSTLEHELNVALAKSSELHVDPVEEAQDCFGENATETEGELSQTSGLFEELSSARAEIDRLNAVVEEYARGAVVDGSYELKDQLANAQTEIDRLNAELSECRHVDVLAEPLSQAKAEIERLSSMLAQVSNATSDASEVSSPVFTNDTALNDIATKVEECTTLVSQLETKLCTAHDPSDAVLRAVEERDLAVKERDEATKRLVDLEKQMALRKSIFGPKVSHEPGLASASITNKPSNLLFGITSPPLSSPQRVLKEPKSAMSSSVSSIGLNESMEPAAPDSPLVVPWGNRVWAGDDEDLSSERDDLDSMPDTSSEGYDGGLLTPLDSPPPPIGVGVHSFGSPVQSEGEFSGGISVANTPNGVVGVTSPGLESSMTSPSTSYSGPHSNMQSPGGWPIVQEGFDEQSSPEVATEAVAETDDSTVKKKKRKGDSGSKTAAQSPNRSILGGWFSKKNPPIESTIDDENSDFDEEEEENELVSHDPDANASKDMTDPFKSAEQIRQRTLSNFSQRAERAPKKNAYIPFDVNSNSQLNQPPQAYGVGPMSPGMQSPPLPVQGSGLSEQPGQQFDNFGEQQGQQFDNFGEQQGQQFDNFNEQQGQQFDNFGQPVQYDSFNNNGQQDIHSHDHYSQPRQSIDYSPELEGYGGQEQTGYSASQGQPTSEAFFEDTKAVFEMGMDPGVVMGDPVGSPEPGVIQWDAVVNGTQQNDGEEDCQGSHSSSENLSRGESIERQFDELMMERDQLEERVRDLEAELEMERNQRLVRENECRAATESWQSALEESTFLHEKIEGLQNELDSARAESHKLSEELSGVTFSHSELERSLQHSLGEISRLETDLQGSSNELNRFRSVQGELESRFQAALVDAKRHMDIAGALKKSLEARESDYNYLIKNLSLSVYSKGRGSPAQQILYPGPSSTSARLVPGSSMIVYKRPSLGMAVVSWTYQYLLPHVLLVLTTFLLSVGSSPELIAEVLQLGRMIPT